MPFSQKLQNEFIFENKAENSLRLLVIEALEALPLCRLYHDERRSVLSNLLFNGSGSLFHGSGSLLTGPECVLPEKGGHATPAIDGLL